MEYGARPLRSVRRLANTAGQLPRWYSIVNAATSGAPTQVSIYDEIGFYGVSAGNFLADMKAIQGDIELHLNSPGGDVFDGIAIYNQLKQRAGNVRVIIDGLAASAASFIAMAATNGMLEIASHAQMMIHDGFAMAIGNASDMRTLADQLDTVSDEIAAIYAERTGKPVAYWRAKMQAETWYTDKQAVADGLADRIHGQDDGPSNAWDLSVYANAPGRTEKWLVRDGDTLTVFNADGTHAPMKGTHSHPHGAMGSQGDDDQHEHEHTHDDDADHGHDHDPDGDGDDDTTAAGDTDHDYVKPDGSPGPKAGNRAAFPVLAAQVDNSDWDASKAWHNGAESDDPAKFYAGICAGRRAGDPATQDAWALPYKYHPGDPVNAAGVRAALARLSSTEGLTNADQAKATLQKAMKQVNPDYDPDALISPAVVAQAFTLPRAEVDASEWDASAVWAMGAASGDPAGFYRAVCAGRRPGDPSTPDAWALPYRYAPDMPPNASAVRAALAELPYVTSLANAAEARGVLDKAMKVINPAFEPDDEIDTAMLAAAFSLGLKGAGK